MATANERLFDLALRHQIDLRRFTTGEVKRILRLLEAIDAETTKKLRRGLEGLAEGVPISFTENQEKRIKALLGDLDLVRSAGIKQVTGETVKMAGELAEAEAAVEIHTIAAASPIKLQLVGVEVSTLRAAVIAKPFQGRLLKDWFGGLQAADKGRLEQAVRLGLSQGENLDNIVRRVAGTRANKYADGVLTISRRNAEAVVRTAINHTSNVAREEVWSRNSDIIRGLRWTATLDGRTSAVCRARDGQVAPLGSEALPTGSPQLSPAGARPPAHFNCRSTMVPVLGGEEIVGERAFVTDTRTAKAQTKDFRADAKEQAGERWKSMSPAERNKAVDKQRVSWASKNIGQVPSTTTYQDWMKKQPAGFQDEVLGKTKGALFRRGGLTLDQYVDRNGNELTLLQLKSKYPDAFDKANLD